MHGWVKAWIDGYAKGLGFLLHLSDAGILRVLGWEEGLQSDVNYVCCLFTRILVSTVPPPPVPAVSHSRSSWGREADLFEEWL